MRFLRVGIASSGEEGLGIWGSGAAESRRRSYGVAPALPLLLAMLLLAACRADGVPANPIGIKLQWFSFLDGDGFKDRCAEGDPDRYRLIYNARFDEQVRVYEVTQYGDEGILVARAVSPGFVLTQAQGFLDFGWHESKARVVAA